MSDELKYLWSNHRVYPRLRRLLEGLLERGRVNERYREAWKFVVSMRDDYETERKQLYARIDELEAQISQLTEGNEQ